MHARKAWLSGLSPKENRDVPPLDYALVHSLKRAFPEAPIVINGGLTTIEQMREQLEHVDGVMIGRAAYHDPALLLIDVDAELFGEAAPVADGFDCDRRLHSLRGARAFARRTPVLDDAPPARALRRAARRTSLTGDIWRLEAVKPGAGVEVLLAAVDEVRRATSRLENARA